VSQSPEHAPEGHSRGVVGRWGRARVSLHHRKQLNQKVLYSTDRIRWDKGTVPVVANGGFGDTTGTLPFGEERRAAYYTSLN